MYSISEDERLELTRHIVKTVNGRVPIQTNLARYNVALRFLSIADS
jgi:dihydrodipicolinate synthase/N-acetylneuraminate lyase